METRAHFILIGLFTLMGIIGGLGFFLWLASIQIDRQYAQYGILFTDVSGLNQSADVSFNGVGVGRVIDIRIWEEDPAKVFVQIEIDATTPVAVDTMAQLESQGVTGVAYIALSGGSPGAAPLGPPAVGLLPIIPSRPSSLRTLVDSAPDLLGEATVLIQQLEAVSGPENQQALSRILQNVEAATANLDTTLAGFNETLPSVQSAAEDIAGFAASLDGLGAQTQTTMENADATLTALQNMATNATEQLDALSPAITTLDQALAAAETFLSDDLPALSRATEEAVAQVHAILADAQELLRTDIDPALADVRTAMTAFAETMSTLESEVPSVLSDVRSLTAEARVAVTTALPGLRDFSSLGGEARALVQSIRDFVRQLGRDPAGQLFNNRVPDYRR